MGNMFYMYYKEMFRRVRASSIAPGLVPPYGPPRHPSFPSGHSFAGHFCALLLLEIDELNVLYGEWDPVTATRGKPSLAKVMSTDTLKGPLLWLASRMAKNRERAGLHYPSDSLASRWMAGAVWKLLFSDATSLAAATPPNAVQQISAGDLINVPTLQHCLRMAQAEWKR
jgi:membrane-associated phospholipid phosphatase